MIRFRCDRCSYDMTPVISDKGIEEYTRRLLSDYKPDMLDGIPTAINAFHFVESYLGARIEFQDIYYEEGQQPILGMTCFAETRVKVFDREHMCTKYITVPPNTIIIDNSVMSCDMAGIGNIVATDQSFRMPQSCTRMLHDIHQDLCCLLEEIRIGLLPLTQSLVSLLGILNRVYHRLSK